MGHLLNANVKVREAWGCCRKDNQESFSEYSRAAARQGPPPLPCWSPSLCGQDRAPCGQSGSTDSKLPLLPPGLAFCRAEGWFAIRKCSSWTQQFSASKAGSSCVWGSGWALALPAPGCMWVNPHRHSYPFHLTQNHWNHWLQWLQSGPAWARWQPSCLHSFLPSFMCHGQQEWGAEL